MFDAFMRFIETPGGFLVSCVVTLAVGVTIYILSLESSHACICPKKVLRRQDGSGYIEVTRHTPECEARHD